MKIEGKSLLVFGSRTLDDERVEQEIAKVIEMGNYDYLITALDPSGVCARARHYAKTKRNGTVLILLGLDISRAAGMHEARSIEALKLADHMLEIWDGSSKGTKGEIRIAEKMHVPTTVVKLESRSATLDGVDYGADGLLESLGIENGQI